MANKSVTTIKDAIRNWEEKHNKSAFEASEVLLYGQYPPIEKIDPSISALAKCEKLSLSTNCIEKISNMSHLKNIRVLSLGRNNIKSLAGIESIGDTLEQLWISYNSIEKLKGVGSLKKLRVLYMSNNLVKEWPEFNKLAELTVLEDLLLVGNPIEEKHTLEGDWRNRVSNKLPSLKKLDGIPIIREEIFSEEERPSTAMKMYEKNDSSTESSYRKDSVGI